MPITLLPLMAPALLLAAAIIGFLKPGRPGARALRVIELLSAIALATAIGSAVALAVAGPATGATVGWGAIGATVRLDIVSVAMLLLVSFIGWVVVRYSTTYLDGEQRQGRFMGWLCLTLASVMLLAVAGSLVQLVFAWVATSFGIHQLLLFYPQRIAAQRAARKKIVSSRLANLALIIATGLLAYAYRTDDIATILQAARDGEGGTIAVAAAGLLALAAILKSAQFPLHGWLTEVMEAPTPVSALLHAGVINAGGFLLIRFADVMLLAPQILAVLVMIGGFTALFGGLVMLTQPAVKTSLAWSTVAQMGFMIMQCGLALFPLALLHIVAHSLYKAHSFLASGGAVDRVAAFRRPGPVAIPDAKAVGRAFIAALAVYVAIHAMTALAFGGTGHSVQATALGAILVFGVAYLLAQGLADAAPRALTLWMAAYSLAASLGYFILHALAIRLTAEALPAAPAPGSLEWMLIVLAVISFALVAVAQAMFPLWAYHPAAAGLRVHLANGLYVNALFDRLLGGWTLRRAR